MVELVWRKSRAEPFSMPYISDDFYLFRALKSIRSILLIVGPCGASLAVWSTLVFPGTDRLVCCPLCVCSRMTKSIVCLSNFQGGIYEMREWCMSCSGILQASARGSSYVRVVNLGYLIYHRRLPREDELQQSWME